MIILQTNGSMNSEYGEKITMFYLKNVFLNIKYASHRTESNWCSFIPWQCNAISIHDLMYFFSRGKRNSRSEVLLNIDPLLRGGEPLYNDTFDSSIRGAIRVGPWKLITGIRELIQTFNTMQQGSKLPFI